MRWWALRWPEHRRSGCVCTLGGHCGSVESLARQVGVSHSTIHRRIRFGFLDVFEADRWAKAVGEHPIRIWPTFDRVDMMEPYVECELDEVAW